MLKTKKIKKAPAIFICLILAMFLSLQSFAADLNNLNDLNYLNHSKEYDIYDIYNIDLFKLIKFAELSERYEKYKNKYYSAVTINDEMKKFIDDKSISPQIDEMLDLYEQYSLYGLTREQALNVMLKRFILNNQEMIPELADSLLRAFDDFGGYYADTSIDELFGDIYWGYGIVFDGKKMADGNLYNATVKRVFKDSPAFYSGLEIGDEFIKINNINVEGLGLKAVSNLLATIENKVELTVKRNGKEMNFTMEKNVIFVSSITYKTIGAKNDTAWVTIENFTDEGMLFDFFMIIEDMKERKYKNLIIDLRNNTGGDMVLMAELLNMLTPDKDVVMFSYEYGDGELMSVKSNGGGIKLDKICVLTNNYTASASEIFALSLSEITGAVLIGEKTYGKGIGQFYISLENEDVVAITAFEILSAKGNKYNKKGLEPNIKIAPKYTNIANNKFDQLNFVNCADIKTGAENKAVLALNQRLARIGYLPPDDITSKCTNKTITAVEIFQKYNNLPVGISKIDYMFIDYLNYYTAYSERRFEETDVQFECAQKYIFESKQAAENYAKNNK